MLTRTLSELAMVRDEIDRYLAGRARHRPTNWATLWLAAREEARRRNPDSVRPEGIHREHWKWVSMGLDTRSAKKP